MRPNNLTLDRDQVHRAAAEHLQAHLGFQDSKRKASAPVLWSLLLAAAARITSLSDACGRLCDAPSDETARKALLATLPDYAALQRRLNPAPAGDGPAAIHRWAKHRESWLAGHLALPSGIPSRDCIRRLLVAPKPEASRRLPGPDRRREPDRHR